MEVSEGGLANQVGEAGLAGPGEAELEAGELVFCPADGGDNPTGVGGVMLGHSFLFRGHTETTENTERDKY